MFWIKRHLYLQVFKGKVEAQELQGGRNLTISCGALSHPRTLMGSFVEIESCFKQIVQEITPNTFLSQAPIVIVHLREDVEGGYTEVELRAFKEAAYGAGGREVFMPCCNGALSNQQIKNSEFKQHKNA